MTAISSLLPGTNVIDLLDSKRQSDKAKDSSFDMLMSMLNTDKTKSADSASSSSGTLAMNDSLSGIFSVLMSDGASDSSSSFGFSPEFTDTFGTSGPLIDYIKNISSSLHLTSAQNQALQDIAIKHQNDAGTGNVTQTIAAELKSAGITA